MNDRIRKALSNQTKPELVVPTRCTSSQEKDKVLWKGPESDGDQGGITVSLLSRFLVCRERFRLHVVDGLRPGDAFNHRLEYGNMWHVCEEFHAQGQPWEAALRSYARGLCRKYPLQQEQVEHWYNVCKVQFPVYVDYWSKHPDVVARTPVLQEQVFRVPYDLPSGRTVYLRGKWDSVDLIGGNYPGKLRTQGIYLQENKTKGDVDEESIKRQLGMDIQVMFYLVALHEQPLCDLPRKGHYRCNDGKEYPIRGVRYNVVRRPLSGGKGTIVRHKPSKSNPQGESKEAYYGRLKGIIEDSPQDYFFRWKVEVTPADIERFKVRCLNPILEQLCDWWTLIRSAVNPFVPTPGDNVYHWQHPYGVHNPMQEGGSTDLDEHLRTGSTAGLQRSDNLFPELG
jgi:hypothetical protein